MTMMRFCRSWLLAGAVALLCAASYSWGTDSPAVSPTPGPVATAATCGAGDRPESGLQGETTLKERLAPGPYRAYNCNLDLIGQSVGEGAGEGFAVYGTCAYYEQWQVPPGLPSALKKPGVVVVDVSNPSQPKIVGHLQTPAMMHPDQSLLVNYKRKLLFAQNFNEFNRFGRTEDIYDISDCRKPVLEFSGVIPQWVSHGADFSPDGTIMWGSTGPVMRKQFPDMGDAIIALDIADPSHPHVIARWRTDNPQWIRFHGIMLSDDGNTAYFTIGAHSYKAADGTVRPSPDQGMAILDVSEVQARKPHATIRMIGKPLFWNDIVHNQYIRPFTVKGHKYAFETDIDGVITSDTSVHTGYVFDRPMQTREEACSSGKPGWGYVSIIDVQDPAHAKRVSSVRLQVTEPKNCLATAYDPVFGHGYSPLDCDFDNYQDAKMMACGFGEGGIRVFDVRDIKHPHEIAYYKPPAVGAEPRPASPYQTFLNVPGISSLSSKYHTADAVDYARFMNGGREVWFTSYDNGFQVLKFSDEFVVKEKSLFAPKQTCFGGMRPPHGCS